MNRMYLSGGEIVDVIGKTTYPGDILIENGLIAEIRPGGASVPPDVRVMDASGMHIAPGFIDSHIHIESSMLPPLEFARAAVPGGTTCALVDPHEITNVFGIKAIDFFMEQADLAPMDMYVGIPSCVPATRLETSGAEITGDDVRRFMTDRRIYGLAEMMDFPDILYGDPSVRGKVDAVFDYGKIVDGHCPGLVGDALKTYVSNGRNDGIVRIMNDHESTDPGEAMEKLAAGMFLAIRYGSAVKNLDAILPVLIRKNADLSRCMLCSDDLSAEELQRDGHVNRIVRRARDIFMETGGLSPEEAVINAIALATANPGAYLSRFLKFQGLPPVGEVAPGFTANLVLLSSLTGVEVGKVIHRGRVVAENGVLTAAPPAYDYSSLLQSVNIGPPVTEADFRVAAPLSQVRVQVRVIDVIPHSLLTRTAVISMTARDGRIEAIPGEDIAKVAVFERHHATGSRTVGFARGLGIRKHAIASTVAHDSHNLIVAGVDDESMARAARCLIRKGGGMVAVMDSGEVYFPLGIGGLMSTESIEQVIRQYGEVVAASRELGILHDNLFMTLSFISLPVIPELKITDRGLVDVGKFDFVPLFPPDEPV